MVLLSQAVRARLGMVVAVLYDVTRSIRSRQANRFIKHTTSLYLTHTTVSALFSQCACCCTYFQAIKDLLFSFRTYFAGIDQSDQMNSYVLFCAKTLLTKRCEMSYSFFLLETNGFTFELLQKYIIKFHFGRFNNVCIARAHC